MIWRPRRPIFVSSVLRPDPVASTTGDFRPPVTARLPDSSIAASLGGSVRASGSLTDIGASTTGDFRPGTTARMPGADRAAMAMPGSAVAAKPLFDTPDGPPGNFRPGAVVREPARPGADGRVQATGSFILAQPPGVATPPRVTARDPWRPGDAGRAWARGATPQADPPVPAAYVVRESPGRPWPGGQVEQAGYAPPEQPSPKPQTLATGQPDPRALMPIQPRTGATRPAVDDQVRPTPNMIRGWDGGSTGRATVAGTTGPPEPRPPQPNVATGPATRWPAGSAWAEGSYDFSLPPGALLPRVVMVRGAERPGFAGAVVRGRARGLMEAVPDPLTPTPAPDTVFESQAPATFRTWRGMKG